VRHNPVELRQDSVSFHASRVLLGIGRQQRRPAIASNPQIRALGGVF
jgi:hypothetical protein